MSSREDRFIGDFRLVRKLGEGGMGVVYEAEQQHPKRPVALKVIRGGAHVSPETLKLFQREAQTLARLRHPGIAALYETGATDDGLHFFAMELVRGSTLTAWLGQRPAGPLTPHEVKLRLSIFKKVCDAVAYAHQKGVIHRDLKPANVLIPKPTAGSSMQDEVPDVKVLDFGLARITDSDVQATTYITEMGKIRGTLPYMSPEQVRGNPDEIDLRTDVYALGVMLYEMMTGSLPYDLSKAQIPEAARIICEQAPKSISASFSGTKHLDADIVTIAGKCLEKEASRRYQSAAALGEDVQRYLSDQPILARPPSAMYQFRKLAARHKGAFAFAATVFVLVTALAVTMTIQAFRISKERDRANQEAETAKQVSDFLEGLFKVNDPSEARGNSITAREVLDQGAARVEHELKGQEAIQARLMEVMGRTYLSLGLFERARLSIEGAIEVRSRIEDAPGFETADDLSMLSQLEVQSRRYLEALRLAERVVEIQEQSPVPSDVQLAKGLLNLGQANFFLERFDEAERCHRRVLALLEGRTKGHEQLVMWALSYLAGVRLTKGELREAEALFRRALEIGERALPSGDRDVLDLLNNLCNTLSAQGRFEEGRPLCERAIVELTRILGPTHPDTLNTVHTLGELERRAGHFDRAEELLSRAVEDAPDSINSMILLSLAQTFEQAGRSRDAEAAYRKVLSARVTDDLHGESRGAAEAVEALAAFLRKSGRAEEAGPLEARARELRLRVGGGAGASAFSPSARPPEDLKGSTAR